MRPFPGPAASDPVPQPAVPAISRLFDRYTVVGLSDLHGCAELLALVGRLVRDPAFLDRANDITWEPGNVRYQPLMDEFILQGRDLSREQLSACWRNNTQAHTYGDTPALFELLRTIRAVNVDRPPEKRLRVLLIDPPIDWDRIRTRGDVTPADFDRKRHMAEVLEREVYAKGRKALFFAGGAHLGRGGPDAELVSPLQSLEQRHPGTTFNIALYEGFGPRTAEPEEKLANWPRPALAQLRGTWWGELPPPPSGDVFVRTDGKAMPPARPSRVGEKWDAVLYLGPRHELTRADPPAPDVLDEAWLEELDRRHQIMGGRPRPPEGQRPQDRQYFPD